MLFVLWFPKSRNTFNQDVILKWLNIEGLTLAGNYGETGLIAGKNVNEWTKTETECGHRVSMPAHYRSLNGCCRSPSSEASSPWLGLNKKRVFGL